MSRSASIIDQRAIRIPSAAHVLIALLAACGDGGTGVPDPRPAEPVAAVSVTPAAPSLRAGDTLRLAAVARSARGTALSGRSIAWRSDDTTIAVVGADGLVRARLAGIATIRATSEGKTGTAQLTIAAAPLDTTTPPVGSPAPTLTGIAPAQIQAGWSGFTLTVVGTGFVSGSRVEWDGEALQTVRLSDTELRAQVSASHVASARTVPVRVTTPAPGGGSTVAASFVVVRRAVASIRLELSPTNAPWTYVGDRIVFTAAGLDGAGQPVTENVLEFTWTSSDTSIATVGPTGGVRGKRPGHARISASIEGKTAAYTVAVYATPTYDLVYDSRISGRSQLYVVELGLGNATANGLYLPVEAYDPAPSPDGSRIAFRGVNGEGNSDIYVVDRDGTNLVRLTTHAAADDQPAWSPNGSRIVFRSMRSGYTDIWVMNADGSAPRNLTAGPAGEVRVPEDYVADPAWSPDGARIAFARTWGMGYSIQIMNADGSAKRTLPTEANDREPTWSADGERLFVTRHTATIPSQVVAVSAENGSRAYGLNVILRGDAAAASPDGAWVVMSGLVAGGAARAVQVFPANLLEVQRSVVSEFYGGGSRPEWIKRRTPR